MPDLNNNKVDIDTSGPAMDVDIVEEKQSKTIDIPQNTVLAVNQGNGTDGTLIFERLSNWIDILPTYSGNNAASWMGKKILTDSIRKNHLKNVNVTYMRFPGGNLSNNYFWDGNIPASTKTDNNYNPIQEYNYINGFLMELSNYFISTILKIV